MFPNESLPQDVKQVVQLYGHLFQEPTQLPHARTQDHHIPLTTGASPVNVRPYRYSPQQKTKIEQQIKEMLKTGVITHSSSPFSSPVLLVKKKDGSWRFCVDYRHLNAITVKDKHPLPVVDELLDEIDGAKWFTKLDLKSGYHQIRLACEDEFKTAFKTHQGMYEFKIMPFGLTNAPASFQSIMNRMLEKYWRKFVLVFMDDILIYNNSLEEHIQYLKLVFQTLSENKFFIKASKCEIAKPQLEYLGHLISRAGVATEPSKVVAMSSWPTPQTVKQLRGFLGLTGYYRRFIRQYGVISRPLTQLLKKNTQFIWTTVEQ